MAMAIEYKTLTFDDTASGRAKMNKAIQEWAQYGWTVHSKETSQQGYAAGKTCCLGSCFLPLALLGKKDNIITLILQYDHDKQAQVASQVSAPNQEGAVEHASVSHQSSTTHKQPVKKKATQSTAQKTPHKKSPSK